MRSLTLLLFVCIPILAAPIDQKSKTRLTRGYGPITSTTTTTDGTQWVNFKDSDDKEYGCIIAGKDKHFGDYAGGDKIAVAGYMRPDKTAYRRCVVTSWKSAKAGKD